LFRAGFRDELFRDDFLGIETSARAKMVAMRFAVLLITFLGSTLVLACSGDDKTGTRPPQPSATSGATATAEPAASATSGVGTAVRGITGLFTDPRPSQPDVHVTLPPRPRSPFKNWDGESVVVYDIEDMTEKDFGPGLAPSLSPDGAHLAYNVTEQGRPDRVRVVDFATGDTLDEFEWTQGLGGFVTDDFISLGSVAPRQQVYDLRNREIVFADDVDDPALVAATAARAAGQSGFLIEDGSYRLRQRLYNEHGVDICTSRDDLEYERCRAEASEDWTLEDVQSGDVLLRFQALVAGSAGNGELVVATSPVCNGQDGTQARCEDLRYELRSNDPPGEFSFEEVHGTTNIFLVNIETGMATFVATASFSENTQEWPSNWPLIADGDYVVWTGSYCSQDAPSNTRIYHRATGKIMELDASLWVKFTRTGDLGVDPFGPKAILDIATLDWDIVLPAGVTDVGESPNGRYLVVGGVLGHGGLC
jgi:hypothetical protein